MINELQLVVSPRAAAEEALLKTELASKLGIEATRITAFRIRKKSLDARSRDVKVNLWVRVFVDEHPTASDNFTPEYKNVTNSKPVIVIGAGPAGLFAAIKLIEAGIKPIVIERGKDISSRKKDIATLNRTHEVDPESNYCFGEGGAGTFSDGKLYTRSNKRGDISRILKLLHYHGATEDVLYEAHPHIGTDKLPEIIKNIRQAIIDCGGEVHFETKMVDLIVENQSIEGIVTNRADRILAKAVILATGHSARDVYEMIQRQNILLESKTFAMGVRVEHPQELIDSIQYHRKSRGEYLPAASYSLVAQVEGRGVYSFCMCPGGYIVPSATENDQVVVNGMSSSRRHTPFANSGIVTEIRPEDLPDTEKLGVLAGLSYQINLERLAKQAAARGQMAPAQRLDDFVRGRLSTNLPQSSYIPGLVSSPLHTWLPQHIGNRLRKGFVEFDKKMHGFLTNEAYVAGVESRTSSPLRIPRDPETLQHVQIKGLFPCGEGAGYAGGIVSSAMDGENAAEQAALWVK